jgi:putative photosynthetic complex assembly protein 2
MMPDHMRYLASYFRIAPPRWFFILSVSGIAVLAAWLADLALSSRGGIATGYALAFALVALAFLEHGFLVVPWQDTAIFRWAMPEQARQRLQKSANEPVTMSAQTDTNPLAVRQNAVQ